MDVIIECHICGSEASRYVCKACGANACVNCFDTEKSMCERCAFVQG